MKKEFTNHYPNLPIYVEEPAFIKDPLLSELGRKIVLEGLLLMGELGYEQFTFKKLALKINSTEASIYRYFASKHKLLIYFFLYYWHDMENRIAFATANIKNAEKRLKAAMQVMVSIPNEGSNNTISLVLLKKLITDEYVKVYFSKTVDEENKKGLFKVYKRVCHKLSEILQEINPNYPWTVPLVSTVMQSIHFQSFYYEHLPSLTNKWKNDGEIAVFFVDLIMNNIKTSKHEAS